ncbi:MAG: hypothetical protein ABFD97_14875 [Syntrophobacter sp.]
MRKTGLALLLLWFVFLTQACISEVKPILKVNPDIPARIANQQKMIDRASKGNAPPSERIQEVQNRLDLVKARYSRLQAEGKLNAGEIRKLSRMLDESGNLLLKVRAAKTAAPPQSGKNKKKDVAAPDGAGIGGEPVEQE